MTQAMLEVQHLMKSYGDFRAVDDLSFAVYEGEIFGLLGPNGAGKTTAIRTIMDIFHPDSGMIKVLGQPPGKARKRVGYLPEERGLYRELKVLDTLVYLAELKGTPRAEASERAMQLLERVDLASWAGNKVRDLSRGMQQKVQFAASLVHDPQLLILDEPFQGLDPVNVALLKDLIRELQSEGKTFVLSAHEMSLVEVLCDRILLINHGRGILYGRLVEIKKEHAGHSVRVRTPAPMDSLRRLPGVARVDSNEGIARVMLGGVTPQEFLRTLVESQVHIESFEVATMPLEEIFISVVRGSAGYANGALEEAFEMEVDHA